MLNKLNKIKWSQAHKSQLPTLAIDTHNELSYNNSKFENLYKKIVKLHVLLLLLLLLFVDNSIYSSSFFIKIF